VLDLEEVGVEPLVKELGINEATAQRVVTAAIEEAKRQATESKKTQAQSILTKEVPVIKEEPAAQAQ
jgi:hypothetical protein